MASRRPIDGETSLLGGPRGLDNVAATGTAMAAAPRLGAFVRRASAHVANKPHHRTISTAAPERRSRGAITRLDGMGVFGTCQIRFEAFLDGRGMRGRARDRLAG